MKRSTVVKVARSWKNYQEKRCNGTEAQLKDFHWKAGSANYTYHALKFLHYTGINCQGQPWCAMCGSDIFVWSGLEEGLTLEAAVKQAKEMLGGSLPYNCQDFVNKHMGDKRLNHTPEVGAPVIYWTGAKYGHWGSAVTAVDADGKGYSDVEGNTSGGNNKVDPDGGAVVEKHHDLAGTTLFWHPDYEPEGTQVQPEYVVATGNNGLRVMTGLNIRNLPAGTIIRGSLKEGEIARPDKKRFIDGKPWYHIAEEDGWISASHLEGWVLEDCGRWWYMENGYEYQTDEWKQVDDIWYYFDNTGYMATSQWIMYKGIYYYVTADGSMARDCYIKSIDKEMYYWVGADGAWMPEWDTKSPDRDKYRVLK